MKVKASDNVKHNMLSSSNNSGSRTNSNNKIEYLPWWSGVVNDKYLCRRLHWHIDRSNSNQDANSPNNSNDSSDSLSHHHHPQHQHHNRYDDYEHAQLIQNHRSNQQQHTLFDMVCDYQWVCHRVEHDGLLGMMSEFKEAMLAADRVGRDDEFNGIGRIATAVQEAARMRQGDMVDMNVWPTFLEMVLRPFENRSECVRDFLSSMYDKARRPWLKLMPPFPFPLTVPSAAAAAAARGVNSAGVLESSLSSSPSTSPTATGIAMHDHGATAAGDGSGGPGSTMVEEQYMTAADGSADRYDEDNYHCLASSASGKVICGDSYGNVHVYDPASGQRVTSWAGSSLATVLGGVGGGGASALRLGSTLGSRSGSGGSGGSGGGYATTTTTALSSDPRSRAVGALGTVQDYVISGHDNGLLVLRSIRSGRWEVLHNGTAQRERWSCIGTTDDGVVAVGSRAGTIFVLKGVHGLTGSGTVGTTSSTTTTTSSGAAGSVKRIDLQGHCNTVTALYVFPDRERIASSSVDGFAAVWKLRPSTGPGGVKYHQRISLNGHKPDIGHKENCISTFASVANGKRLLSACRGGVVAAWNSATGDCIWTRKYGYEFSRSSALHAFGVGQFAADLKLSAVSGVSGSMSSPALGGSSGGDHHHHYRRHNHHNHHHHQHHHHHNHRRSGGGDGGGGTGGDSGGSSSTLQRKLHKQRVDLQQQRHAQHGLRVGYPYLITRGDGPNDLMIVSGGEGREVVATVSTDEIISTWLEVWHASSRRIYIAVSHVDGKLSCYELVTSLR